MDNAIFKSSILFEYNKTTEPLSWTHSYNLFQSGGRVLDGTQNDLFFQVGANQGQTIAVTGVDSRASQLGAAISVGGTGLTQDNINVDEIATFDVDVTVNVGEKFRLLRPIMSLLKSIGDTGEDFSLYVTYTYYTLEVTEDVNNLPPEEPDNNNIKTTPYNNLLNTGFH